MNEEHPLHERIGKSLESLSTVVDSYQAFLHKIQGTDADPPKESVTATRVCLEATLNETAPILDAMVDGLGQILSNLESVLYGYVDKT